MFINVVSYQQMGRIGYAKKFAGVIVLDFDVTTSPYMTIIQRVCVKKLR